MGTAGKVLAPPPKSSGIVRVVWEENGMVLEHRLGREGRVDLNCVKPTLGGSYYVDHLAVLDIEIIHRDAAVDSDVEEEEIVEDEVPENEIISTETARNGFLDEYLRSLVTNRGRSSEVSTFIWS